jgi:subtilase family serine protease
MTLIRNTLISAAVTAALLVVAGAAPAVGGAAPSGGPGSPPTRDGNSGHWFQRTCAWPSASAACNAQVVTDARGVPLASNALLPSAYTPADFHGAYVLPDTASSAQTVGIVDAYNDPDIASDLATYDTQFGLPNLTSGAPGCAPGGCFEVVNESGGGSLPASNSGWALEISLDVETVHEICQNCNIVLVEAGSASLADLGAAENEAAKLGADVITNSWGAAEYSTETSDSSSYFNHPGVAITASAGDSGYGVEFPAASPYVTAVGGTTLDLSGAGWAGETAWSGTGSGCSRYEPKPAWQTDTGCVMRTVSDVAADADPNTGAAVYDSMAYSGESGWFQVGGTSLSAQLIGGIYALAGAASGVDYGSTPYHDPSTLHDVTSGSNGRCRPSSYLCVAGMGYDGPTGLGTPDGTAAFSPTPPSPDFSLGVSAQGGTITEGTGGTATYAVTVDDLNGFSDPVELSTGLLPGSTSSSFSPNPAGTTSVLTLIVPSSVTAGTYTVEIDGADGSLLRSVDATLTVAPPPPPSFTIGLAPSSQSVGTSGSTTYTVTITPVNGFKGTVSLQVSGLPRNVTGSFSPGSVSGGSGMSTLTVTAKRAKRTTATLTVKGANGSLSAIATAKLVVG